MSRRPETSRPGFDPAPSAPPRLGLVPKEHGASFISVHSLLLGIVAGFAAGGDDLAGLAIAIAFGILFLPLAAAISTITHRRLRSVARRRAATLGAAFAVAGATALAHGPTAELLGLGAMAAGLGLAYAAARQTTGPRAIPTQLAAIAGICLFAPLAWLLVAGPTDRWPLAGIAGFLAFGGTVPYVRERVRRRRVASATLAARLRGGRLALAWQAVALGAAAAAAWAGLVHWLAAAAFVPGAVKTVLGLARPETKPPIARIGYVETAISTVFAVLAGVGLGVAP